MQLSNIGTRIKEVRNQQGLNKKDFSDIMNISTRTLTYYEQGERKPDADFLRQLNKAFNIDMHWLIVGEHTNDAFVAIPQYNVQVSAGVGSVVDMEDIVCDISFRKTWLRKLGLHKKNAAIVTARGDSMMPAIKDGAMLLVKTDAMDIHDGLIYVINHGEEAFVKRLRRDLNGIHIISDNPHYKPQFKSFDELEQNPLHIAGRVVWSGAKV